KCIDVVITLLLKTIRFSTIIIKKHTEKLRVEKLADHPENAPIKREKDHDRNRLQQASMCTVQRDRTCLGQKRRRIRCRRYVTGHGCTGACSGAWLHAGAGCHDRFRPLVWLSPR